MTGNLFDKYRSAMDDFTEYVEDMAQGEGASTLFHVLACMAALRVEATLAVWEATRLTDMDLGGNE